MKEAIICILLLLLIYAIITRGSEKFVSIPVSIAVTGDSGKSSVKKQNIIIYSDEDITGASSTKFPAVFSEKLSTGESAIFKFETGDTDPEIIKSQTVTVYLIKNNNPGTLSADTSRFVYFQARSRGSIGGIDHAKIAEFNLTPGMTWTSPKVSMPSAIVIKVSKIGGLAPRSRMQSNAAAGDVKSSPQTSASSGFGGCTLI